LKSLLLEYNGGSANQELRTPSFFRLKEFQMFQRDPLPKMLQFAQIPGLARSYQDQDKAVEHRPNYPLPVKYIQGITLTYRQECKED